MQNNTLHIIGNGFDCFHGLPTRYKDFKQFVDEIGFLANNKTILEEAFNREGISLWSDFERCIGMIDLTSYADLIYDDYEDSGFPQFLSVNVYNWFQQQFSPSFEKLIEVFKMWVWQLEESEPAYKKDDLVKIGFDFDGYFLSFNYTTTLEEVYGVLDNHIFHLHGNANDDMLQIIVGHNTDFFQQKESVEGTLDNKAVVSAKDVARLIVDLMNRYKKPYKLVIDKCDAFLKNIDIEQIIVMGCSFNDIDMPYFEWISQKYPNAKWKLCCYSDLDIQNATAMVCIDNQHKECVKISTLLS